MSTVSEAGYTTLEHGLIRHQHFVDGYMPPVAGVPRGYCYTCKHKHAFFVELKSGTVRYKRGVEFTVTQPGDPLYSVALFAAEQVWREGKWEDYAQ